MIADSDIDRIWERHVLDSAVGARAFRPQDREAVDLGSGAGLPGIALAIELPRIQFTLAESRAKRVGFLEYAVEALGLRNVSIHHGRVEDLVPGSFDIATARAFAPAEKAWEAARPLLREHGRLIYYASGPTAPPEGAAIEEIPVLDSGRRLAIMSIGDHPGLPHPGESRRPSK